MDSNIWCCVVAIVLGVGNVVCWIIAFNRGAKYKDGNREITIGETTKNLEIVKDKEEKVLVNLQKEDNKFHQENKELLKSVLELKNVVEDLKRNDLQNNKKKRTKKKKKHG